MPNRPASAGSSAPRRPRRFTAQDAARLVARLAVIVFSWFVYGLVRTERAEFGFSFGVTLEAAAFTLVPLTAAWSLAVLLTFARAFGSAASQGLWKRWLRWTRVLAVSAVLGWATSETWILVDEARFVAEVQSVGSTALTMRPRAFPHGTCALLHDPGSGFSAMD